MSVWDKISAATRFGRGGGGGAPSGAGGGGGSTAGAHLKTWLAVAVAAGVIYIVYTGLLEEWVNTFLNRLVALIRPLDLIFVLTSALAIGTGIFLMKLTPRGHPLSLHGHRVATRIGPVGVIVGVALLPVVLIVMTLGQSGSLQLAASYLGVKPAANLCQAVSTPSTPVVSPVPRGR
jgi:hypothetical protein